MPSLIYGIISVVCGFISLYVPETLNRPLPNSIEDVLKWPRTLTEEEWKAVDELNKKEFDTTKVKQFVKTKMCCRKRKSEESSKKNENQKETINVNILKSSSSSLLMPNNNTSIINEENSCDLKLNDSINQSSKFTSSSASHQINIGIENAYSSSSSKNSSSSSNSLSYIIA